LTLLDCLFLISVEKFITLQGHEQNRYDRVTYVFEQLEKHFKNDPRFQQWKFDLFNQYLLTKPDLELQDVSVIIEFLKKGFSFCKIDEV
jgi:hypothetical protein